MANQAQEKKRPFSFFPTQDEWTPEQKAIFGTFDRSTEVVLKMLPNAGWGEISATYYYNSDSKEMDEYRVLILKTDSHGEVILDEHGQPVPVKHLVTHSPKEGKEEEDKIFSIKPDKDTKTVSFSLPKDRLLVEQLMLHPANRDRLQTDGQLFAGSATENEIRVAGRSTLPNFYLIFEDAKREISRQEQRESIETHKLVASWQTNSADGGYYFNPEIVGACLALEPEYRIINPKNKDDIEKQHFDLTQYVTNGSAGRKLFLNRYANNHGIQQLMLFKFAVHSNLLQYSPELGFYYKPSTNQSPILFGETEYAATGNLFREINRDAMNIKAYVATIRKMSGYEDWLEAFNARQAGLLGQEGTVLEGSKDRIIDKMTGVLQETEAQLKEKEAEVQEKEELIDVFRELLAESGKTTTEIEAFVTAKMALDKSKKEEAERKKAEKAANKTNKR